LLNRLGVQRLDAFAGKKKVTLGVRSSYQPADHSPVGLQIKFHCFEIITSLRRKGKIGAFAR
jgi:hypothetical protein